MLIRKTLDDRMSTTHLSTTSTALQMKALAGELQRGWNIILDHGSGTATMPEGTDTGGGSWGRQCGSGLLAGVGSGQWPPSWGRQCGSGLLAGGGSVAMAS